MQLIFAGDKAPDLVVYETLNSCLQVDSTYLECILKGSVLRLLNLLFKENLI
jgi:hypothetical protein